MAMPKEFIDLAASVARGRSPVLIDAVASGESYLLSLLKQSGPKRKVTLDLPGELDVDHVSVEMTWFDEESGVVKVAPLRIQKRPERESTSANLDEDGATAKLTPTQMLGPPDVNEDETKRLEELQGLLARLDSDTDSDHEDFVLPYTRGSSESEEALEGSPVTKELEGDDLRVYETEQLTKGPLGSGDIFGLVDIDVTPARSVEENDRGLFSLKIGRGSDFGPTKLEREVGVWWNLHCARDTNKIVLSVNSFSILAAKGSKYFLTQWDMDVVGQDGWLPESWSPMEKRADGRVTGTQANHVIFRAGARVSEAPLEAEAQAGWATQYRIDRQQRPWWVTAGPTPFGGSGVGWGWITTAWSDMNRRTNMREDTLSVRFCRGEISVPTLTIELVPQEKPEVVFRNNNTPQPVPVFRINTTAMYRYRSKLPGRFKFKEMERCFQVVVVD